MRNPSDGKQGGELFTRTWFWVVVSSLASAVVLTILRHMLLRGSSTLTLREDLRWGGMALLVAPVYYLITHLAYEGIGSIVNLLSGFLRWRARHKDQN